MNEKAFEQLVHLSRGELLVLERKAPVRSGRAHHPQRVRALHRREPDRDRLFEDKIQRVDEIGRGIDERTVKVEAMVGRAVMCRPPTIELSESPRVPPFGSPHRPCKLATLAEAPFAC